MKDHVTLMMLNITGFQLCHPGINYILKYRK